MVAPVFSAAAYKNASRCCRERLVSQLPRLWIESCRAVLALTQTTMMRAGAGLAGDRCFCGVVVQVPAWMWTTDASADVRGPLTSHYWPLSAGLLELAMMI